jgi:hypothetical protein
MIPGKYQFYRILKSDYWRFGKLEHWKKSICFFIILLSASILLGMGGRQPMPDVAVEALPQYEVLFSNEDGWTGADGAYSVALNQDTTAWFFGDTWVGQVKNGRHLNATLINNSLAIQQGKNPATATIDFYCGGAADGGPAALFQPADGRGWFWVFDAVMTQKGLYVFLIQTERTPGDAVFDFKVIGTWLGYIDNPTEVPSKWRIGQTRMPWTEFSTSGAILWGSAVLKVDDDLYVYGTAEDGSGAVRAKHMILARVPLSMLADFSRWRFYAGDSWVSNFKRASRLLANVPNEYSVSYLAGLKQYALVYSEDGLSKNILTRLSREPQGPWGDAIPLYQCPEAQWDDSIFCYAAKAHDILSRHPDELVITYIANSVDFNKMVNDARLYRPRFLRVTFRQTKSD